MSSVMAVVRERLEETRRKLAEVAVGSIYQGAIVCLRIAQRGEKLFLHRTHDAAHRLDVLLKVTGNLDHQAGDQQFVDNASGFESDDAFFHFIPTFRLKPPEQSTGFTSWKDVVLAPWPKVGR